MPDSFLRALLFSTVPPDPDFKKRYRETKPARAFAKDYLQSAVTVFSQERRLFWEHVSKQHTQLEDVLELRADDYDLLMQFKPALSEGTVRLLDIPSADFARCYRLGLRLVSTPAEENVFLLVVNCYALRGFPSVFRWGDDLSAFFKLQRLFSSQYGEFRMPRMLSLKYMDKLESLYAPLLADEELQELLGILRSAALEDVP